MVCGPISLCRVHVACLPCIFSPPLLPDITVHFVLLQPGESRMYCCLHTISCPLTLHLAQWYHGVKHFSTSHNIYLSLSELTASASAVRSMPSLGPGERWASNFSACTSFLVIPGVVFLLISLEVCLLHYTVSCMRVMSMFLAVFLSLAAQLKCWHRICLNKHLHLQCSLEIPPLEKCSRTSHGKLVCYLPFLHT